MAFHSLHIHCFSIFVLFFIFPVCLSIPFILLHGFDDQCAGGMTEFTQNLSTFSGSKGYCIEIGNGKSDSWFMPITEQANILCDKVKGMPELRAGYNIVGVSQGNMVARSIIEFCFGGPAVRNYISLGGPHAGIAALPQCGTPALCPIINGLLKAEIYSDFVQDHLAPSGYIKLPNDIPAYLKNCKLLPKINNEIPAQRNPAYKARFSSLQKLVLIMFENDEFLKPKETSWFGFYPDGTTDRVIPVKQTPLYTEDWIGLKALDAAGKVDFISVPGGHVKISLEDTKKHVVPYLTNQALGKQSFTTRKRAHSVPTKTVTRH